MGTHYFPRLYFFRILRKLKHREVRLAQSHTAMLVDRIKIKSA